MYSALILTTIKNVQQENETDPEKLWKSVDVCEQNERARTKAKREEKIGSLHSIALYLHFMKISQCEYKTPMRYNSIIL